MVSLRFYQKQQILGIGPGELSKKIRSLRARCQSLYQPHGIKLSADVRRRLANERINVIFDVGANLGQSAREFEKAYPRSVIYSFEPDPDLFPVLQRSIGPRTTAIPVGVSSRSGKFRFDNSGSGRARHRIASNQDDRELPEVQFTTIDSFCTRHNITRIDLLKIDTEGHDLDVIKGAEQMLTASSVGIVIAECSMNRDNTFHVQFGEIHRHMEQLGYRLFGIYEQVHEWPTRKPNLRRTNAAYISPAVIARNVALF